MQLVAKWQDTCAKSDVVYYRLCSNSESFVIERESKDALGGSMWSEVRRFQRLGVDANIMALLAIGLEEVGKNKGRGKTNPNGHEKDAIVDSGQGPTPFDVLLNLNTRL